MRRSRKNRCQIGKSCGLSCVVRTDKCKKELLDLLSKAIRSVKLNISANAKRSKPDVNKLMDALKLSPSERKNAVNDAAELRKRAEARKRELWREIGEWKKIGGVNAKKEIKLLQPEYDALKDALGVGKKVSRGSTKKTDKEGRILANRFDKNFITFRVFKGDEKDFDWAGSVSGSTFGGKGQFGVVLLNGKMAIKRGEVGEEEMQSLIKVGRAGVGPTFIYGETGKQLSIQRGVKVFEGRIAMSKVEGSRLNGFGSAKDKVGNETVADLALKARAGMHRLGIAHGDMHGGNVYISEQNGKGIAKILDFGMSQNSWKAALSEAIGLIATPSNMPAGAVYGKTERNDYQARNPLSRFGYTANREDMPATMRRMSDNFENVKLYMADKLGLKPNEIASVMFSGLRNPRSFYTKNAWAKISDDDAKELIDIFYKGV